MAYLDNLETISERQIINGRNVWVGSTTPVGSVNGDIWIDSSQVYGNIFTQITSGWAGQIFPITSNFDGLWSSASTSPLRALLPIHDKSAGVPYTVVLRRLVLSYLMPGTAHSSTNCFVFSAFWRNSTTGLASALNAPIGSPVSAIANSTAVATLTYTTANSSINRSYHEPFGLNSIVGGVSTAGCIQLDCARTGTPTAITGCTVTAWCQLMRALV